MSGHKIPFSQLIPDCRKPARKRKPTAEREKAHKRQLARERNQVSRPSRHPIDAAAAVATPAGCEWTKDMNSGLSGWVYKTSSKRKVGMSVG